MPGFYGSCNPIEWIGTSPPSFSRLNLQELKPFGPLITFAEAAGEPESWEAAVTLRSEVFLSPCSWQCIGGRWGMDPGSSQLKSSVLGINSKALGAAYQTFQFSCPPVSLHCCLLCTQRAVLPTFHHKYQGSMLLLLPCCSALCSDQTTLLFYLHMAHFCPSLTHQRKCPLLQEVPTSSHTKWGASAISALSTCPSLFKLVAFLAITCLQEWRSVWAPHTVWYRSTDFCVHLR